MWTHFRVSWKWLRRLRASMMPSRTLSQVCRWSNACFWDALRTAHLNTELIVEILMTSSINKSLAWKQHQYTNAKSWLSHFKNSGTVDGLCPWYLVMLLPSHSTLSYWTYNIMHNVALHNWFRILHWFITPILTLREPFAKVAVKERHKLCDILIAADYLNSCPQKNTKGNDSCFSQHQIVTLSNVPNKRLLEESACVIRK